MVVNPYKANDGRQRIAEPYYSSSGHPGTQRPLLFGVLSTRNMIIMLLAAIAVVSYIFHIHHTFVEDGNVSSVQVSSKLRGSVSSTIDNIKNSLAAEPSLVPTWHPTRKPTFASTAATTSPRPTLSPTTIQPTATPTPLPTSASVAETSSVTDGQQQTNGFDQAKSASNSVSQPTATSQVAPSIANDNKDELSSISEDPVNSKDGDGLNEHNDNARAAYLSLLESMKKRPTIGRPGPSHVSETISDAATHDKEKEQFFPPNRKPDVLPPNFGGKSLQVPPQKATASDGMIPFVPETKPNQIQRLSPPGEEDTSSTSMDTTAEGQTPVRMKFDLPSNVQLQSKSRESDPTTSVQSTDKVDHCKLQSDPFQSQPIESFVPPTNAPFAKVLEWQTEVKSVLKNIGKMRIGGDKLRQHLQEEVTRLRIKRFNTFCEYL